MPRTACSACARRWRGRTPTAEADTIRFAEAVQGGTIVLAGSQLTVASDVTIDGGSGVTLDADERSRVVRVDDGSAADSNEVNLRHLTFQNGAADPVVICSAVASAREAIQLWICVTALSAQIVRTV